MKNILVIDDNLEVRSAIAATLAQSGYVVRQAGDGRDGIRLLITEKPDLILCDVKMPGLDGYRTLEAIRKCPGTAAIPFILMTGSMGPKDFRRGMVSGADDYLMKPFTPAELLAAVESRFARQVELQTDIVQRVELRRQEEFRQLSRELSLRPETFATKERKSLHPNLTEIAAIIAQPVYCLD